MKMNMMRLDLVSSFLETTKNLDDLVSAAGTAAEVATVSVDTLDRVVPQYANDADRIFLQIDVHGFEQAVLNGAQDTLKRALGLKIEMALVPMYEGESLMPTITSQLYDVGFRLVGSNPVCVNRRKHLLWVHGYFIADYLL